MKKETKNVARHELIGLEVTVESPHPGWNGLSGRVVDETKHTFLVERPSGKEARVPKAGQRFVFRVAGARVENDGDEPVAPMTILIDSDDPQDVAPMTVVIDGDELTFRPEDRTKKIRG